MGGGDFTSLRPVSPKVNMGKKFDIFLRAYMECALWSSTDNSDPETGGDPLDQNYSIDDISSETREQMGKDCAAFWNEHRAVLARDPSLAGHDFWLSRNGHGAGFFDREWYGHSRKLQAAAKAYGDVYLYAGDDGRVYA